MCVYQSGCRIQDDALKGLVIVKRLTIKMGHGRPWQSDKETDGMLDKNLDFRAFFRLTLGNPYCIIIPLQRNTRRLPDSLIKTTQAHHLGA
jgi:hypothetical protein